MSTVIQIIFNAFVFCFLMLMVQSDNVFTEFVGLVITGFCVSMFLSEKVKIKL